MTPRFRSHPGRPRAGWWFLVVLLIASGASAGRAKAADPETLIRQGIEHRRADRNLEALNLFKQAYGLQETPRALAQIGMAEQALGRWGAADRHLRQAMESADDPWIRKNRAAVDNALKVIGGRVGRLDVTGTPVGAEVRVDGELIGRLPFSAPASVTAGGVAIEIRAPGYIPIVRAATVSVGVLVRESFDLQSLSPAVEPVPQVASPRGSGAATPGAGAGATSQTTSKRSDGEAADMKAGTGAENGSQDSSAHVAPHSSGSPPDDQSSGGSGAIRRGVTWGIAGLALATLTLGIVEHVVWQGKVSSFEQMAGCDRTVDLRGGTACQKLYNDGESAKKLAFVGYGLGAGLAITAGILYFTTPTPTSEATKVACAVNPLTPGIGCLLRF